MAENLTIGKAPAAEAGARQALEEKVPAAEILHEGLIAGMSVVGKRFKNSEFYIPEVLIAVRAMTRVCARTGPLTVACNLGLKDEPTRGIPRRA